jgi:dUTP pyrophosphatase
VNDDVRAFGNDVQVIVGHNCGHFHNGVLKGIEPRHFQVHPSKHGAKRIRIPPTGGTSYTGRVINIPVKQLDAELPLPQYARLNDAGLDLLASEPAEVAAGGGRALVPTGLSIAIPPGYAGFVQPRSGLAVKHGVTVLNSPGLIDAGYRGEIKVALVNTDPVLPFKIERGDRIAQLVIQKVEHVEFQPVDELPSDGEGADSRGAGGFGHTG